MYEYSVVFVMIYYVTNKIIRLKKADCVHKEYSRGCNRKRNKVKDR